MSIITKLTKTKRGRVSVFLDGTFCLSVDLETAVKFALKVGNEIEQTHLEEIQFSNEKSVALEKALGLVARAPKTTSQMRDYLKQKGYAEQTIAHVLMKLDEYSYVNDEEFAERFILERGKREGVRKMKAALYEKGIRGEALNAALALVSDESQLEGALNAARAYMKNKLFDVESKAKLYRFLNGRGFNYDVVSSASNTVFGEHGTHIEDEFDS